MFGKGAILVVLGFSVLLGAIVNRLTSTQNRAIENTAYYHDVTKSHNMAFIGANTAMSRLYQDSTLRGVITAQTFSTGTLRGGQFTARVDSISVSRLRLRSISTFQAMSDTVEVYLDLQRLQSFSMFAWMTNFEGNVYWITKDTVWGRVHSNSVLNVNGSPVFMEKVTTSKLFNPKPGVNPNKAIFKRGYETGVAPIKFPNDISDLINSATVGGRVYTGNIWVTLTGGTAANNDGKAYIRHSSGGAIFDSVSLSDPSFNGAIVGDSRVYLQGTVDGKLSVGSLQDVVVTDDIVYEKNPLTGSSDDLLGIVADQNVIVANNAANNNNCEIDASIFARVGSFTAENYSSRPISGTLKIVGGIIQNIRGPVGTFSGSTIVSGFSKRYYFDQRLANSNERPPFFPGFYRKTLAIANWWENVRIPKNE